MPKLQTVHFPDVIGTALFTMAHHRASGAALACDVSDGIPLIPSLARLAALAAVSFHPDIDRQLAERIAMQASTDPDAAVQSKALELMAHVEAMQTGDTADGLIRLAVAP